jgi:F-type H+-transporting ATPase subunit gamma
MKLVSAAKLRKAQQSVVQSREYRNQLNALLLEVSSEEVQGSDLLQARPSIKKVRLLVVGGSRGLCGAYNSALNKRVEAITRERTANNAALTMDAVLLGRKPAEYFRRTRRMIAASYEELSEDPNQWPIDQVCDRLEKDFLSGEVDEVLMVYTRFRSAISMSVEVEKLLPMDSDSLRQQAAEALRGAKSKTGASQRQQAAGEMQVVGGTAVQSGGILFEPSAQEVFSALLPRILRSNLRQACLEARASEHGSRMTAMDAATKNAGELSQSLQLKYNKLRQLGITSQLLDIVGGAEALN